MVTRILILVAMSLNVNQHQIINNMVEENYASHSDVTLAKRKDISRKAVQENIQQTKETAIMVNSVQVKQLILKL